jgi:hypothetical protein
MRYTTPQVIDYGSITEHTFTACQGLPAGSGKVGNPAPINRDKFCECSHTDQPDLCNT